MDAIQSQRRRMAFLYVLIFLGVGVIVVSLLTGSARIIPIGVTFTIISLILTLVHTHQDRSSFGKRHAWLFGAVVVGFFLQLLVFLLIESLLGVSRVNALIAASAIALLAGAMIAVYGVRTTQ